MMRNNNYSILVLAVLTLVFSMTSCIKDNEKAESENDLYWDAPYSKDVIVFDRKNWSGHYDIYKINADGTGQKNITRTPDVDERYPAVSHDGERVAFVVDRKVTHSDFNGENKVDLTGSAFLVGNYIPTNLSWSNKSTYITFNDSDVEPEVFYVATNYNLKSAELFLNGFSLPDPGVVAHAAFYGNENKVLSVVKETDYVLYATPSTGFVPLDSANMLLSTTEEMASPKAFQGKDKVVFCLANGNGFDICVRDESIGAGYQNLTLGIGNNLQPTWSPDGTRIAYASNVSGNWDIWIINADGTGNENLTQSVDWDEYNPNWN